MSFRTKQVILFAVFGGLAGLLNATYLAWLKNSPHNSVTSGWGLAASCADFCISMLIFAAGLRAHFGLSDIGILPEMSKPAPRQGGFSLGFMSVHLIAILAIVSRNH